jgi:hypothetical protein
MRAPLHLLVASVLGLACSEEASEPVRSARVERGSAQPDAAASEERDDGPTRVERDSDAAVSRPPAALDPDTAGPLPPLVPTDPTRTPSTWARDAGDETDTLADTGIADAGPILHPLVADEYGRLSSDTNDVGVEGVWSTNELHDSVVSGYFDEESACISGTISSGTHYGARLVLLLTLEGDIDAVWDGSAYSGFTFSADVTMSRPNAELRVLITTYNRDDAPSALCHQKPLVPGPQSFTWDELTPSDLCPADDERVAFDPSQIVHFEVVLGQVPQGSNDFMVCISELAVF